MRIFLQLLTLMGLVLIGIVVTELPKDPVNVVNKEVVVETQKVFVTDEHVHVITQEVDLGEVKKKMDDLDEKMIALMNKETDLQELNDKLDILLDIMSSQLEEKG